MTSGFSQWRRRTVATSVALVIALAGSATSGFAAPAKGNWHGLGWGLPGMQSTKSVAGRSDTSRPLPHSESSDKSLKTPPPVAWPAKATVEIDIPAAPAGARAAKPTVVAGTPLAISRAARPNVATNEVTGRLRVEVLDRATSERAGVAGVMMKIAPVSGDVSGPLSVDVDYAGVASAYGAGYGSRLRLVSYPECVLSTPDKPECRVATPLPATNIAADKRLASEFALPERKIRASTATPEPMVVAAAPGPGGGEGDMTASTLSPAGSWSAGGSSGAFTYNYPITLPAPPAGEAPGLSLSYSSATVDGATSATNNQPSWIGDGWSLSAGGHIERFYKSCAKDLGGNNGQTKTGDQCWATDNATISLGASNGPLVKDKNTGVWRPKGDDGTKIERLTGAANGARDGEHWKVTTTDGTQYFFGLNRLPGWVADDPKTPETQSTFTAPVFGNNAGEPCHQATFAASSCQQAYRWNLDYVVDPNGNQIAYYYQPEINYYGLNRNTTGAGTKYVRGGYLLRMDYGLNSKAGGVYAPAPARVLFDPAERCVPSGTVTCAPEQLNPGTASSWPDVPADQICKEGVACPNISPTFFSRKRLASITTQITNGAGGWNNRDKWTLAHSFPASGDGTSPVLWFGNIVHTGLVGGSLAMPPTIFGGTAKTNRTFASRDYVSLSRYRITSITGELGGSLTVDYSAPDCQGGAPAPATNATRCYPMYWTSGGKTDPEIDWFNKYVVTDVYADGRTALSVQTRTHYDYEGGGAWHFDENFLADPAHRTWSQWRGYGEVVTTTGNPNDPAGPRTKVKDLFMRGMNGDKAATGTKSRTVTNSRGEIIPDSDQHHGFKRETLSYLDGNVFTGTVNDPWSSGVTATDANGVQSFFTGTAATRTQTWIASANAWRDTRTSTTFNNMGLPVAVQEDGDVSVPSQATCSRTTYVANAEAWIHVFPSSVQKVAGPCADTNPATSANIISEVRKHYDGKPFGTAPAVGKLTQADTMDSWPSGGAPTFQSSKTTYDTVYGRPLTVTDPLGRETATSYTPATGGPVSQVTTTSPQVTIAGVPTSLTTVESFDTVSGLPKSKVDGSGLRSDKTYDPLGRVTAVWAPGRSKDANVSANATFEYAVNTSSPSIVTSKKLLASGLYSSVFTIIDGLGRTVQVQEPTSYASGGRVVTDTQYDSQGRPWKTHNAYWNSAAPQGNLLIVQDNAVPNTTVASYDSANRAVASRYLLNGNEQWHTTTAYDGDRVTTIPPEGGTASAVISNGIGQKVRTQQFKDRARTGPADAADVTTYTYTPAGSLETVKDSTGQNTWTFGYDLLGRKTSQTDPDSGSSTYTYDATGQLKTATDSRGKTVAYAYDNLGRKTASHDTEITGTRLTQFTYDSVRKGLPATSVRFVSGKAYVKTVTSYDDAGRPGGTRYSIPNSEWWRSGTYTFNTAYDHNTGAAVRESSPGIGGLPEETIFRDYDTLGLPTASYAANGGGGAGTQLVSETKYNPFGQPLRVNYADETDPKQVSTTWTYEDGTNRLNSMATVRATTTDQWVTNRSYSYTQSGALTKIADAVGGDTQCFGHDYLQRLTKAWTPSSGDCSTPPSTAGLGGAAPYWQEWTHDETGNRRTETKHEAAGDTVTTLTYPNPGSPKPHAVSSATTASPTGTTNDAYTYDNSGNTLTRTKAGSTHTFTYDIEGHVATATDPAGKVSSYLYDADGNRLITRDPTGTTLMVGDTELFIATGTTTAKGTRFYTHGGQQVAVRTSAGLTWKVTDHHGTSTASIKASDLSVSKRFQDPYGNVRGAAPSVWPDKRGFIGGYQDTTSLVHIGAREYDPAIGRFISVDPILDLENPQSWNGYAYANNNPIDHSDPTGLYCDSCDYYTGNQIGVDCPPCGGGGPPPSSPGSGDRHCDGCNSGKGWPTTKGKYPARVGSNGRLALDWSKMAKPPLLRDLNRHFHNYNGEWYPNEGEDLLDVPPGYVPPEELSTLQQVLMTGAVVGVIVGGVACIMAEPCGAIVLGAIEAAAPPMSAGLPTGVAAGIGAVGAAGTGLKLVDDVLDAGAAGGRGGGALRGCVRGNSFSPDTPVLMADGTTKAIESVEVGDFVLATDPLTGETIAREVTAVHRNYDVELTDLTITDEHGNIAVLHTTQHHKIWDNTLQAWIPAGRLQPGNRFRTPAGQHAAVASAANFVGGTTMYDLTVSATHTYYVLAAATPVLVHNTCDPDLGPNWKQRPESEIPCSVGCERVAAQIQKNIGGEIMTIQNGGYYLGKYRGQNTEWFSHTVVVKDGRVFDGFSGRTGVSIAEYKGLWEYNDIINFGF